LAKNRKLRLQIDDLRKEMMNYKEINKKLKKELTEKKELMERELNEAEDVYLMKEEAKKKLSELKKESETMNKDYQDELRKLKQAIAQDKKQGILEVGNTVQDQTTN